MNYVLVKDSDLVNNPAARVPICLCLDVSGSMDNGSSENEPIDELNKGVELFFNSIQEDDMARFSAEIAMVTFGGNVTNVSDFATVDAYSSIPKLTAFGLTPMGEAVNSALDLLDNRKKLYQSKGIDYYQPWIVLMTDGSPNGDPNELQRAIDRTIELTKNRKLTLFPIGIGPKADMDVLQRFSPNRTPLRLQGLKFREFFAWLSQSVSRTSQSIPGEDVPLDLEGIKGWGSL